jgi:cobalt-zinc-cadmium efflux system membrane fusion protein
MKPWIQTNKLVLIVCATAITIVVAVALLAPGRTRDVWRQTISYLQQIPAKAADGTLQSPGKNSNTPNAKAAVDLSPSQLTSIKIEPVGTYQFPVDKETVGNISFADEQSVQVFPAFQGTIIKAFAELGSQVEKDQPLYTIKSPDLIQAESTLIGAAAQFELTKKELERVKGLPGVAQREVEQATSDEQTADGALKAAIDAVRVFGKTDAEIDQMIASRKTDPALLVRSPIAGKITAYNAPPGLMVQPGNPPAPYTVAVLSVKWMLADVMESDLALLQLGQPVQVKVMPYPNRVFKGKISKIYPMVDPNTHRETVRSEIDDPKDELRPGMLANFIIRVEGPVAGIAIPANGVVREPDGTMTAWATTDRHHFEQRVIKTGMRKDDRVQILNGLRRGELVVTDGAVFLSSMLSAPAE